MQCIKCNSEVRASVNFCPACGADQRKVEPPAPAAPKPSAAEWHYMQNGAQCGPVSREEIHSLFTSGALSSDDLVWSEGLAAWTPIHQVPGLIPVVGAPTPGTPPPPAPADAPIAPQPPTSVIAKSAINKRAPIRWTTIGLIVVLLIIILSLFMDSYNSVKARENNANIKSNSRNNDTIGNEQNDINGFNGYAWESTYSDFFKKQNEPIPTTEYRNQFVSDSWEDKIIGKIFHLPNAPLDRPGTGGMLGIPPDLDWDLVPKGFKVVDRNDINFIFYLEKLAMTWETLPGKDYENILSMLKSNNFSIEEFKDNYPAQYLVENPDQIEITVTTFKKGTTNTRIALVKRVFLAKAIGMQYTACYRLTIPNKIFNEIKSSFAPGASKISPPPPPPPPQGLPDSSDRNSNPQLMEHDGGEAMKPKDVQSWISMGNNYFDSHQYQKSVEAYAIALELQPNNPDVLTDQGVMYKELHAYEKAEANFEKAQKLNPQHIQSLFNLGVLYFIYLNDPAKAQRAFARVIDLAPASPQAAEAKKSLEALNVRAKRNN